VQKFQFKCLIEFEVELEWAVGYETGEAQVGSLRKKNQRSKILWDCYFQAK
jgi:hypothetical protein